MSRAIDTTFDVYSEIPQGADPDKHSSTLRKYHKILWSKKLPNGSQFDLSVNQVGCYLHHKSDLGEQFLSSDSIGHTYRDVKAMNHIIKEIPTEEISEFYKICSTIGAYIVFPARMINGRMNINAARGLNHKIKDRFDLTLLCIKYNYEGKESPLGETLSRYDDFFKLFINFEGYVNFFLLGDLINGDENSINFFLPFRGFGFSPLPANIDEYRLYRENVTSFITARNERINSQFS